MRDQPRQETSRINERRQPQETRTRSKERCMDSTALSDAIIYQHRTRLWRSTSSYILRTKTVVFLVLKATSGSGGPQTLWQCLWRKSTLHKFFIALKALDANSRRRVEAYGKFSPEFTSSGLRRKLLTRIRLRMCSDMASDVPSRMFVRKLAAVFVVFFKAFETLCENLKDNNVVIMRLSGNRSTKNFTSRNDALKMQQPSCKKNGKSSGFVQLSATIDYMVILAHFAGYNKLTWVLRICKSYGFPTSHELSDNNVCVFRDDNSK
ncbi:hypothetical protein CLF_101286 [Clonorchis sinensis]|uniref:Uncharacterized protein n=1 Tax=Clonorchis sinensis TaxID=79923 RepID=H2KP37_CLOSI|nr:hypothetical protein CLF_101286 [Clonorchis sinensis]